MKIALAQVNPTVGDLVANRKLVQEAVARAVDARADLVLLPEMVLCAKKIRSSWFRKNAPKISGKYPITVDAA